MEPIIKVEPFCVLCLSYTECKDILQFTHEGLNGKDILTHCTGIKLNGRDLVCFCETCLWGMVQCYQFIKKCRLALSSDHTDCSNKFPTDINHSEKIFVETLPEIGSNDKKLEDNEKQEGVAKKRKKGPKGPHKCEICSKIFNVYSKLKKHKLTHTDLKPYSCDVCEKAFKSKEHVKCHMRVHTGETPYACDLCGKRFRYRSFRKFHMQKHAESASDWSLKHGLQSDLKYGCDVCGTSSSTLKGAKRHSRIHVEDESFECVECKKVFRLRKDRKNPSFTPKDPFMCNICDNENKKRARIVSNVNCA